MVRTLLTWRIQGEDLVGTRHIPTPGRAAGLSGTPAVGILLLNSGAAMRSGNSDLSVRIGDRLALRGFPVFRFDLAGLGDSSGTVPVDLDSYWSEVVAGRNDDATAALIARIQLEFGVARVLVGGLCAAVLPSVRALQNAGARPAGLILLEPNFRSLAAGEPGAMRRLAQGGSYTMGPTGLQRGLSALGLGRASPLARATRPLRVFLDGVVGRRIPTRLPRDANLPLLTLWQAGFAHGVRSLVVVAAGQGTDRYMTRILAALPARAPGLVAFVRVPGTNHLFTSGAGGDAVLSALERWVMESFGDEGRAPTDAAAAAGRQA